jgi:hypothetical protein
MVADTTYAGGGVSNKLRYAFGFPLFRHRPMSSHWQDPLSKLRSIKSQVKILLSDVYLYLPTLGTATFAYRF